MRRSCCRPICYRVNNKSRIHEQKMNRVPPAHSVLSSNAKQASQATPAASPEKPAKRTTANPHGNHAAADPATKLTTNIRPCIRSANSISLNPILYAQVHFLRKSCKIARSSNALLDLFFITSWSRSTLAPNMAPILILCHDPQYHSGHAYKDEEKSNENQDNEDTISPTYCLLRSSRSNLLDTKPRCIKKIVTRRACLLQSAYIFPLLLPRALRIHSTLLLQDCKSSGSPSPWTRTYSSVAQTRHTHTNPCFLSFALISPFHTPRMDGWCFSIRHGRNGWTSVMDDFFRTRRLQWMIDFFAL